MALQALQKAINETFSDLSVVDGQAVMNFITYYAGEIKDAEESNYMFHFGQYKGQKLSDILKTQKGKDYLRWLSAQEWAQKNTELMRALSKISF